MGSIAGGSAAYFVPGLHLNISNCFFENNTARAGPRKTQEVLLMGGALGGALNLNLTTTNVMIRYSLFIGNRAISGAPVNEIVQGGYCFGGAIYFSHLVKSNVTRMSIEH